MISLAVSTDSFNREIHWSDRLQLMSATGINAYKLAYEYPDYGPHPPHVCEVVQHSHQTYGLPPEWIYSKEYRDTWERIQLDAWKNAQRETDIACIGFSHSYLDYRLFHDMTDLNEKKAIHNIKQYVAMSHCLETSRGFVYLGLGSKYGENAFSHKSLIYDRQKVIGFLKTIGIACCDFNLDICLTDVPDDSRTQVVDLLMAVDTPSISMSYEIELYKQAHHTSDGEEWWLYPVEDYNEDIANRLLTELEGCLPLIGYIRITAVKDIHRYKVMDFSGRPSLSSAIIECANNYRALIYGIEQLGYEGYVELKFINNFESKHRMTISPGIW